MYTGHYTIFHMYVCVYVCEDPREDVGVGVGVVECGLYGTRPVDRRMCWTGTMC